MLLFALTLTLALLPLSIAAPGTQRIDAGGGGSRADDIQARQTNRGATRHQATWGLARISSGRSRLVNQDPLSRDFNYTFSPRSLGLGTQALVIGTGCDFSSPDFSNKTPDNHNRTINVITSSAQSGGRDFDGLGTNLAAIIGGQLIGVAPQARLLCIKVGDLDPDVPNMIEAIRFAVQLAGSASTPSVILLPFVSGFFGQAFDDAVAGAIKNGVPLITPAGDGKLDAKEVSPPRIPGVISVGATDIVDKVADFSNFGQNVTLFAPGVNIFRLNAGKDSTMESAAYVAGVALNLMSGLGKQMSPDELKDRLVALALRGVIQGITDPKTPNLLLNNGFTT